MEMMGTRVIKEKPPVVYDLDDFRHGLANRPNDVEVTITPHHRINLWTIQAGQTVPLHEHSNSECIIIVLAGQGAYCRGGQSFDISKDQMTVVPPGTAHGMRNKNSDPLVMLTIEGPGNFDTKVLESLSGEKMY
jgi:mannose-6-phosphate isomerase-like protein (cupin superfamily)